MSLFVTDSNPSSRIFGVFHLVDVDSRDFEHCCHKWFFLLKESLIFCWSVILLVLLLSSSQNFRILASESPLEQISSKKEYMICNFVYCFSNKIH